MITLQLTERQLNMVMHALYIDRNAAIQDRFIHAGKVAYNANCVSSQVLRDYYAKQESALIEIIDACDKALREYEQSSQ